MSNSEQQVSKPVYKVVTLQAIIASLFAVGVGFFAGGLQGISAAAGGAIAVIGSLIYAMIIVGKSGGAEAVLKAHFRAEMVKIFITAILFMLVLLLFHSVVPLWLILGFAVATLSYWFALLTV